MNSGMFSCKTKGKSKTLYKIFMKTLQKVLKKGLIFKL